MSYHDHLLLHILWFALYSVVASFIAKLAYQRDSLAQGGKSKDLQRLNTLDAGEP
jgi:hypothetical protein